MRTREPGHDGTPVTGVVSREHVSELVVRQSTRPEPPPLGATKAARLAVAPLGLPYVRQ